MGGIVIIILLMVMFYLVLNGTLNSEGDKCACNLDCKNCPFPPCEPERVERWKKENDLHNG